MPGLCTRDDTPLVYNISLILSYVFSLWPDATHLCHKIQEGHFLVGCKCTLLSLLKQPSEMTYDPAVATSSCHRALLQKGGGLRLISEEQHQ